MPEKRIPISLKIPEPLHNDIEEKRGEIPRTKFILEILKKYLYSDGNTEKQDTAEIAKYREILKTYKKITGKYEIINSRLSKENRDLNKTIADLAETNKIQVISFRELQQQALPAKIQDEALEVYKVKAPFWRRIFKLK